MSRPGRRRAALAALLSLVAVAGAGASVGAAPQAGAAGDTAATTASQRAAEATSQGSASGAPQGSAPGVAEFVYRARPGDTLIGLSARLLLEPRRWPELQRRNAIADPRRIPLGSRIRIPYDWLRLSSQPARVLERAGDARVDGREVAVGAEVAAGALLETGADGALTLGFGDGSVLAVQPASRLRLERLQRVEGAGADESVLMLERGKLEMKVRPRGDMGRFEIRTPAAVSAVRGTEFRAGYRDDGAATTETLDGLVGVDAGGAGVAVEAGFGTRAEPGRPPLPPVALLPAPALEAVAALHDTAVLRWTFPPVAGAVSYRHQVARDALFRALAGEAVSVAPAAEFAGLADGRYWIRSRAIDGADLEGFDASREIEQRRRLDPPAAIGPRDDARRIGAATRFEWEAAATASAYRFELARDAAFEDRVAEREVAPAGPGGVSTQVEQLAPGRYFWRIAALDAAGTTGHWSAPLAFEQKPLPAAVEILPVDGPQGPASDRRRFRWTATAAGQAFEWQLSRQDGFERVLRSGRSTEPALVLEGLQPGRYYLRVRARDADGFESPWGPAGRFDVAWPTWVRFLLPVVLLIPTL